MGSNLKIDHRLEREQQTELNGSTRNEIWVKVNKIANEYIIEKTKKVKNCLLGKRNKIAEVVVSLIKTYMKRNK